ncbi:MAG: sensor histidine kinase [Syntrophomonas sp.]
MKENNELFAMEQLDTVLSQLLNTLEKGRNDIFDISEACYKECNRLEVERKELNEETSRVIAQVEKTEVLERRARLRLTDVSRNFLTYSEEDIKEAYDNARLIQLALLDLRQKEMYLRRQRDDLDRQIKQMKSIAMRADNFLQSTAVALKLLEGNIEKISESIEENTRKQQVGMWIIESQEAERRKIGRELHDGPAQNLVSMLIRLDFIERLGYEDETRINEEINSVKDIARETLADVRSIMFDLKPPLIQEDSFTSTLREYFNEYETRYNFHIDFVVMGDDKKFDFSLETALFRLVQEAITNVKKHAGVNRATVKVENKNRNLTMVIKDGGKGFDLEAARANRESYGIIGMKERVDIFGGKIDIISAPGSGTQVIIKIPWEEEASNGHNKGSNSR